MTRVYFIPILFLMTWTVFFLAIKPTWQPSAPRSISISPTVTFSPSSSMCTDTEGWYSVEGYDCVWYEVMDDPGCPQYGSQTAHWSATAKGSAKDNCCYCKNDVVSTLVSEC
jgi:hypothetical protein